MYLITPKFIFILIFILLSNIKISKAQEKAQTLTLNIYLVSSNLVQSYTLLNIKTTWRKNHKPEFIVPVNYRIDVYKIMYKALWIDQKT